MPRFLFVTLPEKGHFNPLIGVSQHLIKAGHAVAFYARRDVSPSPTRTQFRFEAQLRAAGVECPCFAPGEQIAPPAEKNYFEGLNPKSNRDRISEFLIQSVPSQLPALREAVRDFKPDVIVTNPMLYAAALVAEETSLPWAGFSSSFNALKPDAWTSAQAELIRSLSAERDGLLGKTKLGMDGALPRRFKQSDALSPWLNVVFTTNDFVPRSISGNDHSFQVGPSRPVGARGDEKPFPWERIDASRPLVYVSLGSQFYYNPKVFLTAVKAVSKEAQLILAVNELIDEPTFTRELPADVIAVHYAPQIALLDRADVMIGHGGANSVTECLSHGVPLVMLPFTNDQPDNGRLLEVSGAGRVIAPQDLTVERCRDAVLPLLAADAPERLRAKAIGASYQRHDGALRASELLVELARNGHPLRPTADDS